MEQERLARTGEPSGEREGVSDKTGGKVRADEGSDLSGAMETPLAGAVRVDEGVVRDHLGELVRTSVEETLNGLLDAEADALCGAGRYERKKGRVDTRAGHYTRKLGTRVGTVELKMPKLRTLRFETATPSATGVARAASRKR